MSGNQISVTQDGKQVRNKQVFLKKNCSGKQSDWLEEETPKKHKVFAAETQEVLAWWWSLGWPAHGLAETNIK